MHLAIDAGNASIERNRHCSVVVESRSTPFKERCNDRNAGLASDFSQCRRGRAGNGFREVKEAEILALAEVLSAKQLRQTNDVRSETGGLTDVADSRREVRVRVGPHPHLNQANVVLSFVLHVR